MKIVKVISISAISGFILSLFFGFFSHSGFLHIFINALIFAVVFAVLAIGIYFVYNRFLADSTGGTLGNEEGGADTANPNIMASAVPTNKSAHTVDITIDETDLEQSGNNNHYEVGEHKQMLNPEDYLPEKASVASEIKRNPRDEFVPLRREETVDNFSGTESVAPNSKSAILNSGNNDGAGNSGFQAASLTSLSSPGFSNLITDSGNSDTLDSGTEVLPEIGDMSTFSSASSESSSPFGSSSSQNGFESSAKTEDTTKIKDAPLLAKAISSILAEES